MTAETIIITHGIAQTGQADRSIPLETDRITLAKRRWRGTAEDGTEFGFDLEKPIPDGALFFQTQTAGYCIRQKPEPVLEIRLRNIRESARLAWSIGNLHFPAEITDEVIRVADDPALRQLFAREHVLFIEVSAVFHPHQQAIPHVH